MASFGVEAVVQPLTSESALMAAMAFLLVAGLPRPQELGLLCLYVLNIIFL